MISAGELIHRITLQYRTSVREKDGGETVTWNDECTLYAKYTPLRGRERQESQQQVGEITGSVTIRYRRGVNSSKRFYFDGRVLEIKSVINVNESNEELQVLVKEIR